jgi:hypothetical protein
MLEAGFAHVPTEPLAAQALSRRRRMVHREAQSVELQAGATLPLGYIISARIRWQRDADQAVGHQHAQPAQGAVIHRAWIAVPREGGNT